MKSKFLLLTIICFGLILVSCNKEDPIIPNEEELITTLNYELTPEGGGTVVTLIFRDIDGDGGNAPEITGGTLEADKSYSGVLELLNESESPIQDITQEIMQEDVNHQFFFQSNISNLSVSYNDQDTNGNPVGLNTILTTSSGSSGTLTITLRHEPNKTAAGVSNGEIANAGGETDIEVTFPIDVQ